MLFALGFWGGLSQNTKGAVTVQFTGGNGAPLSVTIPQPISFIVTEAFSFYTFGFVIEGVQELVSTHATGRLKFSINGGPGSYLYLIGSGFSLGEISPDDVSLWAYSGPSMQVGDVVTLGPGTITGLDSTLILPPSRTSFEVFMVGEGLSGPRRISENAIQVPEPSFPSLTMIAVVGFGFKRRRRQATMMLPASE